MVFVVRLRLYRLLLLNHIGVLQENHVPQTCQRKFEPPSGCHERASFSFHEFCLLLGPSECDRSNELGDMPCSKTSGDQEEQVPFVVVTMLVSIFCVVLCTCYHVLFGFSLLLCCVRNRKSERILCWKTAGSKSSAA
jgi:hypothetical protein